MKPNINFFNISDGSESQSSMFQIIFKAAKDVFYPNKEEPVEVEKVADTEVYHAGMNVFKVGNTWKWVGVFTNSFRDNDNVPEIFSSDAHRRYVDKVDSGERRLPELWLYHEPLWKVGKASFVALDEVTPQQVFVVAGGDFDADKSFVAEKLAESDQVWKMSHAVPVEEIIRNADDSTVFENYWSYEVTIVPAGDEANPLTAFGVIGDKSSMIAQEKRARMKDALGVDDAVLDRLEAVNAGMANAAKGNREYKSADTGETETVQAESIEEHGAELEPVTETENVPEIQETNEVENVAENQETEEEQGEEGDGTEVPDLAHVLFALNKTLAGIDERLTAIEQKQVAPETEEDDEEESEEEEEATEQPQKAIEPQVSQTPVAFNIYDVIKSSIIGNPVAQVGNGGQLAKIAKNSPVETEATEVAGRSGISIVDELVAGSTKR